MKLYLHKGYWSFDWFLRLAMYILRLFALIWIIWGALDLGLYGGAKFLKEIDPITPGSLYVASAFLSSFMVVTFTFVLNTRHYKYKVYTGWLPYRTGYGLILQTAKYLKGLNEIESLKISFKSTTPAYIINGLTTHINRVSDLEGIRQYWIQHDTMAAESRQKLQEIQKSEQYAKECQKRHAQLRNSLGSGEIVVLGNPEQDLKEKIKNLEQQLEDLTQNQTTGAIHPLISATNDHSPVKELK